MEILENIKIDGPDKEKDILKKCGICGDPHFYRDCNYVVITAMVSGRTIIAMSKNHFF